ncbi:MAG: hypothetical protein ACREV5_21080 [Steroidobacter sp.]
MLAVVSALTSAEPLKNGGVWFFGVGTAVLAVTPWVHRRRNGKKERVKFDAQEIRRFLPDGRMESISWSELREIGILTTDEGPGVDDVFWLFLSAEQSRGCAVSNYAEGFAELLPRIQELPGFDNEAVVKAMGSASNNRFVVWRAESAQQRDAADRAKSRSG